MVGERNFEDLTGNKYGKLLVIGFSRNYQWSNYWNCQCECGNQIEVKRSSLTRKRQPTRSCGCLILDVAKKRIGKLMPRLPYGEGSFNKLYATYRRNAENREFEFNLTKEEFRELTKKNCFYCGIEPSTIYFAKCNGNYVYNGIDRIDSKLGYTLENCITSCSRCNIMKLDMIQTDFLNHISKIYEHTHE